MAKRGGRSGRKYVRDNRGRFATTGATARGGRLKTASGKKRATQTVKAKTGGKPSGAIKGKIKRDPGAAKPTAANSARATGKLARPVAKGNIRRTGGRLGPKNTIKPGPKSPRTKMNRAIDNVIKKGKALKGSAEKLRGVKKQADALRGRMLKEDKGRLSKALSKPSVTDKRSRDYGGRLTKGARGQDPATGGKKSSARRKADTGKPAAAKRKKTDLQRMQQADRIMGKLAKRQKAVVDKAPSLNEGLKQVRRNNARAARVNQSLASKGLLAKYTRLTAPADPIRMTPAGKGIPKSRKPKRRRS